MEKTTRDNEARYRLTPKGIAGIALMESGLIQNTDDPRFEEFWKLFVADMEKFGYATNTKEDTGKNYDF